MIEIFNRLQQIFGRPITLVRIDDSELLVTLDWWGKSFLISHSGDVVDESGEFTAYSDWIEKLLQGAKRNDAGELVQQCEG